jgi:hypothetical protein
LTYTEEMKARKREIPEKVTQAIAELSNQFHRVLPFNYSANSLSLSIHKRKILSEKFNLLQVRVTMPTCRPPRSLTRLVLTP